MTRRHMKYLRQELAISGMRICSSMSARTASMTLWGEVKSQDHCLMALVRPSARAFLSPASERIGMRMRRNHFPNSASRRVASQMASLKRLRTVPARAHTSQASPARSHGMDSLCQVKRARHPLHLRRSTHWALGRLLCFSSISAK